MSMSPNTTASRPADQSATQNDGDVHEKILQSTSTVVANAKKIFGSSSLPVSFGKYDSFYSSLRDSEMEQRQKLSDSVEQMRRYRGDGTCVGGRRRRENNNVNNHTQYSEAESVPSPIDDDGKAAGDVIFMSKVLFPSLSRTPLRNSFLADKADDGSPTSFFNPSEAHTSTAHSITPIKGLEDSFMEFSIQSPEPDTGKQSMPQEDTRSVPMPTPPPTVSHHTETTPFAEYYEVAVAGKDVEEETIGTLNEPADEQIAAASGVKESVQEQQMQCTESSPYADFSEGAMTGQGVEEETIGTLNERVDEHMVTTSDVKESVQEQQLQCKDDASKVDNDESGESDRDKTPSAVANTSKAEDHVSSEVDVPSEYDVPLFEDDVPSKEVPYFPDGHLARDMTSDTGDINMPDNEHSESIDTEDEDHSYLEAKEVAQGTTFESTEEGGVLTSFESPCEAVYSTTHNGSSDAGSVEELKVSVNPGEDQASATTPVTPEKGLENDFMDYSLQSSNNIKQPMPQEDTHCLPMPTSSPPVSHDIESKPYTECSQGAICDSSTPLEKKPEHLKPPSKSYGKNAKSTTTWKRKSNNGIKLTSPLKRQKLDKLFRKPWGAGVQLYNGRSIERICNVKRCENKFCKWEPRALPYRAACERCWTLASRLEREEFIANGRHLRIAMVKGGCPPACTLFPRGGASSTNEHESGKSSEDEEAVRLCCRCFVDMHHVGIRE